ncbi:MAG TPA: gamma carbonic anhydrase family protein [Syntrophomonadaceae bacterium]|nr:gamma carbonic anhydrase family protein [Syntrophomonadaceae bacterium]
MALYEYEGKKPVIPASTFIHPNAVIIGDVVFGENCYVGAGAVVRGDYGSIQVGDGSNIQENCVVHAEPTTTAVIEADVLIGHGSIVHGPCLIKSNSTIGMGSVINVETIIEEESLLASGSVLPPRKTIPKRKIAMGNPARVVKDIDDRMLAYNKIAIELYQDLGARCKEGLKLIED